MLAGGVFLYRTVHRTRRLARARGRRTTGRLLTRTARQTLFAGSRAPFPFGIRGAAACGGMRVWNILQYVFSCFDLYRTALTNVLTK